MSAPPAFAVERNSVSASLTSARNSSAICPPPFLSVMAVPLSAWNSCPLTQPTIYAYPHENRETRAASCATLEDRSAPHERASFESAAGAAQAGRERLV